MHPRQPPQIQPSRWLALLFALALLISLCWPTKIMANATPEGSAFTFSLADLPGIQAAGSMDYPNLGRIAWQPGTRPEDLFTAGMMTRLYDLDSLSLTTLAEITGNSVDTTPLSAFPVLNPLTLQELVQIMPGLAATPLNQAPPLEALARQSGVSPPAGATVGSVAPMVNAVVGELGSQLMRYGLSQIPGLSNLSLSKIPGLSFAKIKDIPFLKYFPLINPLTLKDYFVKFDIGYGMSACAVTADCAERNINNTASGNLENTHIPCMGAGQSCAHIEVIRNGPLPYLFNRWISKEQRVPGGNGFLCSTEPTGRFPFGRNPKVVIENINEAAGEITLAMYFSIDGPFGLESAHCFGPFPLPFFGTAREGGWVLFGPDVLPTNMPAPTMGGAPGVSGGGGSPVQTETPVPMGVACDGQKRRYLRPTRGPITSGFGWRIHPIRHTRRFHAGVDIAPPLGTPVLAADCGIVSHAGWMGGYGNTVILRHPNGQETLYAHMHSISVQRSQSIKRGQVIGAVGSTGESTGPHLHFEVIIGGIPQNPALYTDL